MIRIGTRGSELALWQANHVASLIGRDKTEIVIIKTSGDRIQNVSFDKIEGKGFFTKEIEEALLARTVDLAIHSMKDLPTDITPGLKVAAVTIREDPSDVLLIRESSYKESNDLPLRDGAVVGTSSLRRAAQIKHIRQSLEILPLRGNVTTRIKRLREQKFDAIILAKAGIKRLGINLDDLAIHTLPFNVFLPAPAQGALALQIRQGDVELDGILRKFNHEETERAVRAERCFLSQFGGGCHIPLGSYASISDGKIHLAGVVASTDGHKLIRKSVTGDDPELTGAMLAGLMKEEGAEKLL